MSLKAAVEIEEEIHSFTPADNGAGPLWCHGSTIVARREDQVFVAALETLPDHPPLHNCRWLLYARDRRGWRLVHRDLQGRTREPSPIALLGGGDLLVSANPTLAEAGARSGPARPTVYRFDTRHPEAGCTREEPVWEGEPAFSEHSYRSVAADGPNNEALYIQNVGMDAAHLSFLSREGRWSGRGRLLWPRADEYDPPQPLRLCYPNVFLRERQVHFFAAGDIVEPVQAWREAKFALTRRRWDYVFRRLFYAWTPDIAARPFGSWIEIANRDATAGATHNSDIWLAPEGTVHLLWRETSADARLRERFFPRAEIAHSLEYAQVRQGRVQARRTLARLTEGQAGLRPQQARFHQMADGSLVLLASFAATDSASIQYRLTRLHPEPAELEWSDIPFAHPLAALLTSTVRGGSAPSDTIDMVGICAKTPHALRYARVRLEE